MTNNPACKELMQKNKTLQTKLDYLTSNSITRLFELSIDMLSIADIDGYFKLINPAFEKTLGYGEKELMEHSYLDFVHPDDQEATKTVMQQLSLGQPVINFENRYRCKDGSYKWLYWTSMPIIEENLTYAVSRDITKQKLMAQSLQDSYSYLESIFRASPVGIGLVKERILTEVNEKVCQITGYTRKELIGRCSRMLYPSDDDYDYVGKEKYRQIQETGTGTVETRMQCKDGHIIDVLLSSTPLDIEDFSKGVTFTLLDISERKKSQIALQTSQEKYLDLYDHAPDMYISVDGKTAEVIECNKTVVNVLGYAKKEIIGRSVFELYTPECAAYAKKNVIPVFQKNSTTANEPLQLQKKDGGIIDVSLAVSAFRDDHGNILRSRAIWHDISETKRLERQLKATLERYKGFFEQAPQPYQSLDKEGYLIEANAAWRKTMGYDADELKHKWFGDLLAPGFKEHFQQNFPKFQAIGEVHGIEFTMLHKDGHPVNVSFDGRIVNDKQGNFQQTHCLLTDISEQKRINAQLTLFRQQIEQSKDAVYVVDYDSSRFLDVNESACNMLGYTRAELLEKSVIDISTLFNSLEKWQKIAVLEKKHRQGQTFEDEQIHRDGRIIPVEVSTVYQINNGKKVFVSSVRDISERKIKEEELKEKNQFIQSVIDGVNDAIMVINADYSVPMMNRSARNLVNEHFINDISSPKCYEISHHQDSPCSGHNHPCPLSQVINGGKAISVIHQHESTKNKLAHFELNATPLKDRHGEIYAIIESTHDISSLFQVQQDLLDRSKELDHQAHHDGLTNLPNRTLFLDRLSQAIKLAQRNQYEIAILFIDLDRFKAINDSFGHSVGDEVLKEIAKRLKSCIRKADTVARLGGDEFTVIIDGIKNRNIIIDITLELINTLAKSIFLNERQFNVTSSIGISLYPDDGLSAEALLRNADSAMYKAKEEGRNTYQYYTEDMTEKAFEHILLEQNLRQSMQNNELVLYYQPQVNAQTHHIIGMEALLRWEHPELGLISPAKFIPLAESTGLIIALGEQVLHMATKQMSQWMQYSDEHYRLAINLSVRQLIQDNFVERVAAIIEENQCKPQWIEFEVTEGYIMINPERAIKTLEQLEAMGFSLSIDDFGTGYSSLAYLKRLPIHKLKIDQSFVRDISIDEDGRVIVSAIISLAKSMRLNVIAEGVETYQQKDFLLKQECESIQGYLYSRPVPDKEMTTFLQSKIIDIEL